MHCIDAPSESLCLVIRRTFARRVHPCCAPINNRRWHIIPRRYHYRVSFTCKLFFYPEAGGRTHCRRTYLSTVVEHFSLCLPCILSIYSIAYRMNECCEALDAPTELVMRELGEFQRNTFGYILPFSIAKHESTPNRVLDFVLLG